MKFNNTHDTVFYYGVRTTPELIRQRLVQEWGGVNILNSARNNYIISMPNIWNAASVPYYSCPALPCIINTRDSRHIFSNTRVAKTLLRDAKEMCVIRKIYKDESNLFSGDKYDGL